MENLKLKCYTKENKNIVLDSQGMHAMLHLTTLLWNDQMKIEKIIKLKTQKDNITIHTATHIYEFENVPIQWDGRIDTSTLYVNHIQELKSKEVI